MNKLTLALLIPASMTLGAGASAGAVRLTNADLAGIHAGDVGTGNGNGNGNVGNFNGNGNSGNNNGNGNLGNNNGNGNPGNGQGNNNAGDNHGNGTPGSPSGSTISAPAPAVATTAGVSAAAVVAAPTATTPAAGTPAAGTPAVGTPLPVVNLQGMLQGIVGPLPGVISLAGPSLSGVVPPGVLTIPMNLAIPPKLP